MELTYRYQIFADNQLQATAPDFTSASALSYECIEKNMKNVSITDTYTGEIFLY